MRMTASWFGSLDPPNTRLWRDWYAHSNAGSPLIVIPTPSSGPACSELSRYGLASAERMERLVRRPTLTAPARAGYCGSGRRNRLSGRTKKPIKKERKFVALKPLDNIDPIQGTSGTNREAESTDAPARGGLLRSSKEAGVMPVERRGQVTDVGSEPTGNRRSSNSRRKAAAFARWHEPDELRGSSPVLVQRG